RNRGNIGGGVGVSLGECRRREPPMIVGRGGILEIRELRCERLLLRGRRREQKQDPAEDLVRGRGAQVMRVQEYWGLAVGDGDRSSAAPIAGYTSGCARGRRGLSRCDGTGKETAEENSCKRQTEAS